MKKTLAIFISLMIVCLAACSSNDPNSSKDDELSTNKGSSTDETPADEDSS